MVTTLLNCKNIESTGDVVVTFTVWKVDGKILQGLVPGISVSEGLKNDF